MRHFTLLTGTCLALTLNAQWSLDAANPMTVCDATNSQRFLNVIGDGGTGWFVFWSDLRNDPLKAQLFGQHFDEAGVAQWTPNGELIFELPSRSLNEMAPVLMDNGDVILAIMTSANNANNADTVRAIRIDQNAQQVWSQPALLSVNGSGIFGNCFYYSEPKGVRSGDGAFFCYHGDSQGSNGYYVMQRVRGDGSVAFDVPGIQVPYNAGYANHTAYPDGAGGMVVSWRCSGGVGTCVRAIRVDSLGAAEWGANLDITAGSGLGGARTITSDGAGGFLGVWSDVNADIAMMRYDTTGAVLWNPSPQFACDESHDQQSPDATVMGNVAYVVWTDNRPPANFRDLYMQKIDLTTGAHLWAADGVPVVQNNSYSPTARVVPSIDGAIGIMDFTGTDQYCAMRMNSDGTQAWPAPTSFATTNLPNYDLRTELPDGQGGVVSFWTTSNNDLYGARIYANGELGNHIGIEEADMQVSFSLYPNPAAEALTIASKADRGLLSIEVFGIDGRLMDSNKPSAQGPTLLNVFRYPSGVYAVRVSTRTGISTRNFIKQ